MTLKAAILEALFEEMRLDSSVFYSGYSVPLVLRTAVGIGGALGPQHSQSLHAWVSHIPGLKVVSPHPGKPFF
jgi:pyruvate/2-oxoglutarate/acetoin dehydrogenase E1 component